MKNNINLSRVLFFSLLMINFSCSKKENENIQEYKTVELSPPQWIIGSWLDDNKEYNFGWEFSESQVNYINGCDLCSGENFIENAEYIINLAGDKGSYVSEQITDDYYFIIIYRKDKNGSFQQEYKFFKRDLNQIEWVPSTDPNPNFLTKQN